MSSTKKHAAAKVPVPRNEGEGIPVTLATTDSGLTTFHITLTDFAAPEQTFTADHLDVIEMEDRFRFVFWMSKSYGSGARALVELIMSKASAKSVSSLLEDIREKVEAAVAAPLTPLEVEPENALALSATFARLSSNELMSILDFFVTSPLAMQVSHQTHQIQVKDVIRIQTSEAIFYAFSKRLLMHQVDAHAPL